MFQNKIIINTYLCGTKSIFSIFMVSLHMSTLHTLHTTYVVCYFFTVITTVNEIIQCIFQSIASGGQAVFQFLLRN